MAALVVSTDAALQAWFILQVGRKPSKQEVARDLEAAMSRHGYDDVLIDAPFADDPSRDDGILLWHAEKEVG